MRTDDATTFTATVSSCTRIQSPMTPISVRPFTLLRLAGVQSFRIIAHEKMRIVASSQNAKYPPPRRWVQDGTSIRHRAAANRHAGGLRPVAHITAMAWESSSDRPPDRIPSSANCQKPYGKLPNTSKNKIRTATHSDCVMLQVCSAWHLLAMHGFDPCSYHFRWRTVAGMSSEAIIANARLRTLRSLMPMAMDHVTEGRTAGTKEIRRKTVRSRRATARAVSSFGYFSSLPPTHPPCFLTSQNRPPSLFIGRGAVCVLMSFARLQTHTPS